jgi:small subunit ribosomal protein S20
LANTKSAKKALRQAERRRQRNQSARSAAKTFIKKAQKEILAGRREAALQAVVAAISALDKAAEKGILHKNNAARRKSRLMKKLNAAFATS